jgi:hypothetical protein
VKNELGRWIIEERSTAAIGAQHIQHLATVRLVHRDAQLF